MKKLTVFFLILTMGAAFLAAQEAKLSIVWGEGNGIGIIRGGKSQFLDFSARSPVGFELMTGDVVNVEARTSLEMRAFPTQTVVRVAESSSFTIRRVSADGRCDIDVTYGRLRTRIDDAKPASVFLYNGVSIAGKGRAGADFGFDRVFGSGKKLTPSVYCLEGALEISGAAVAAAGAAGLKPISVQPQEMVIVTQNRAGQMEFLKSRFGADVKSFWAKNEFRSRPVRPTTDATALAKKDIVEKPKEKLPTEGDAGIKDATATQKTDTRAPVEEKKPEVKKPEENVPLIVDNKENALGAREKLSAVNEKDIFVNPDLSKEKDAATTAATPPPNATEEKKEEPAAAPEEKPKEEPAPAPEAQGGGPVVGIALDFGFELDYLLTFVPPPLFMPLLDALKTLLETLERFKAGAIVSFNVMFFDIIGIGLETGLYYNEITRQDPSYAIYLDHYFSLPLYLDIRLTLGPVFIQPQVGVVLPGSTAAGYLEFRFDNLRYEMGGKAGVRLGGMIIFGSVMLSAPTIDALFTTGADFRFGGGFLFKIF